MHRFQGEWVMGQFLRNQPVDVNHSLSPSWKEEAVVSTNTTAWIHKWRFKQISVSGSTSFGKAPGMHPLSGLKVQTACHNSRSTTTPDALDGHTILAK